jgi:hypothetical protein
MDRLAGCDCPTLLEAEESFYNKARQGFWISSGHSEAGA